MEKSIKDIKEFIIELVVNVRKIITERNFVTKKSFEERINDRIKEEDETSHACGNNGNNTSFNEKDFQKCLKRLTNDKKIFDKFPIKGPNFSFPRR